VRKGTRDLLLKFFGTRPYLWNGWSKKRQICHADL